MGKLILARHGESEWNKLGIWTGLTDVDLTELGRLQAREAGQKLGNVALDYAFTSELQRAQHTLDGILLGQPLTRYVRIEVDHALNEKDYGVFTGKNKEEVRAAVGDEEFLRIRRSWDYRIENGESLEDVHARVVPFHENKVVPIMENWEEANILVVSHNNTMRAYIKELEDVPVDEVASIELSPGEMRVYRFNEAVLIGPGATVHTPADVY